MNNYITILGSENATTVREDNYTIVINTKSMATIEHLEGDLTEINMRNGRVLYTAEEISHFCARLGIDSNDDGSEDEDDDDDDGDENQDDPDDDLGSLTIKDLETMCDGV